MAKMTAEEKRQRKIARRLELSKQWTLGKCVNKTAKAFQELVRLRSVGVDGKLTCCSCGKRDYPSNGFDAGHWIGRTSKSTILDSRNVHPQCAGCNRYPTKAVTDGYDEFMRLTYGQEVMDEVTRLSKIPKQWTREELAELYVGYREDIHRLRCGLDEQEQGT